MDSVGGISSWWVRHASAQGTAGQILGWTDLSADLSNGETLASAAAKLPGEALWYCSSLVRAHETAVALRSRCRAAAPLVASDLIREQNFGAWEGRRWDDIDASEFWQDPANCSAPEGESFADVVNRTAAFLDDLRALQGHPPAVVVAHAGPIRAAVGLSNGQTAAAMLDLRVDYLSVTEIAL